MTTTHVASPTPEPATERPARQRETRLARAWRRWIRAAAAAQRCGVPF